jgi:hypothetical protein
MEDQISNKTTFKYKLELFYTSEQIWSLTFFAEYMIIITNLKAFYYIITLHSCTIGEYVILNHSLINVKK